MKVKKLLKDEKGAVLPLVTIILGLFALGFIALVVDVGTLYIERKAMITSADAAALAGAQVLRESEGADKSEAELAAKNFAIKNGADPSQVQVFVGNKSVTIPSGATEYRQVVEVTVGKNKELIFARFLGDEDTDVKAHAVATWGYVKASYIGSFIPLFTFNTDYKLNTDIFLHDKIQDSNGYGFIDIGTGMADIKKAIAGNIVGGSYIYDNYLDGKPGNGASLYGAVEERMEAAQKKATPQERKKYMIGIVPIIDRDKFMQLNDGGNAKKWQLPIKYFAYFEIIDVIKPNKSDGSDQALDPNKEYTKVASSLSYSDIQKTHPVFLLGRFTGEIVEARTIAEIGDQIDPNPGGDTPATYSKLIK